MVHIVYILLDRFNVRKSKELSTRNTKCSSIGVFSMDSSKATKNEVLQISQSLKMKNNVCDVICQEDKPTQCSKSYIHSLNENSKDTKSVEVCDDKHTALSLQIVVSTKNSS